MDKLIATIDEYVKKVPPLPTNIKDVLVKIAPWLAIIGVVLSLPAVLGFLGLGALFSGFGAFYYGRVGMQYTLTMIFLIVSLVIRGLSIPGLFSRSIKGWNFMFYSVLADVVYSVFSYNLVSGLIGAVISLYLLFQVREYYK